MKVFHTFNANAFLVPGPADLDAKPDGLIFVRGEATPAEASRWASSIGLFVLRGGSVRRLP